MARRRLKYQNFDQNLPENLQTDFINLTLADFKVRRNYLLSGLGFSFSLSQPHNYLIYLRTFYHPLLILALEKFEKENTGHLTFKDPIARNFLSILRAVLVESPIPDRIEARRIDPMERLLLQNSILFNTNFRRHPSDPRFQ